MKNKGLIVGSKFHAMPFAYILPRPKDYSKSGNNVKTMYVMKRYEKKENWSMQIAESNLDNFQLCYSSPLILHCYDLFSSPVNQTDLLLVTNVLVRMNLEINPVWLRLLAAIFQEL